MSLPVESPSPDQVLTKALLRGCDRMGLSQRDMATAIGVSEASVSRFRRGQAQLKPESKEGELGLLLLRVFRSLDALVGGDAGQLRSWMHAEHRHLAGTPVALIQRVEGLVRVVEYLDAMRGTL